MQETNNPALRRCFGMREAVTITAGSVIGVGLFTVGSNIVGSMGSSVIFATLAALLIGSSCIVVGKKIKQLHWKAVV